MLSSLGVATNLNRQRKFWLYGGPKGHLKGDLYKERYTDLETGEQIEIDGFHPGLIIQAIYVHCKSVPRLLCSYPSEGRNPYYIAMECPGYKEALEVREIIEDIQELEGERERARHARRRVSGDNFKVPVRRGAGYATPGERGPTGEGS